MTQSPNPPFDPKTRPTDLAIDRTDGVLRIVWQDGAVSEYPFAWLRENCPCATCNEKRAASHSEAGSDIIQLGIRPSYEVTDAVLVGNYAIQPTWGDGHATGFFAFSFLRGAWDQGGVAHT